MPVSSSRSETFERTDADDRQVVVLITTNKQQEAESLAERLLGEDLIACANLVPKITSIYKWQGKVEKDEEILMLCKTISTKVPRLTELVCRIHSYDEPEVIALDIQSGSKGYLDWVRDCVAK
ncbi:hypothetical protein ACQY0O_002178 [Thecaphora frezii]